MLDVARTFRYQSLTLCLSVFDHFVKLVLKGLNWRVKQVFWFLVL